MRNDYDPRSVEILFEVYWSTTGWKQPFGTVSQADFEHAKAADVMFPPIRRSHDEVLKALDATRSRLDRN